MSVLCAIVALTINIRNYVNLKKKLFHLLALMKYNIGQDTIKM